TFEVGTGADYAPISVTVYSVAGSAATGQTLTASTTGSAHPNLSTSGFNLNRKANRYWTVTRAGTWTFAPYAGTFPFVDTALHPTADPAFFAVRTYNLTWPAPPGGSVPASHSTTGLGFTSFSDFAVGDTTDTTTTLTSMPNPSGVGEL